MRIFIISALAMAATGCASFEQVTYGERIQIRQDMARLQNQAVQRQIIRYGNDKHHR
jgi:hypothetical protein